MAEMQFIFDLIWMQSSGNYLAETGQQDAQPLIAASAAILALFSLAIFAAHALDAYRTRWLLTPLPRAASEEVGAPE